MEQYGALPFIYGTLVSSFLALLIAVPLGVGSALFLAEMAPKKLASAVTFMIELLAAIPSVILGLMGIFVLVPAVKYVQPFLIKWLGFLPFFRGQYYGIGLLTAALILAILDFYVHHEHLARYHSLGACPAGKKRRSVFGRHALVGGPPRHFYRLRAPAFAGSIFLALGARSG